jgi:hypothetical protein
MGWKRVLVALAVVGAAFGIASAVQASIPDASGIVHACYNNSNANGYPIGALRAIDLDKVNGHCAQGELPVDLATPQLVTSTINQTSFMFRGTFNNLAVGQWVISYFCPAGYVDVDPVVAGTDQTFPSNDNLTPHSFYNQGELVSGVPNTVAIYFFQISNAPTTVTAHATCVDGRVFGLPGPAAPIKQAQAQATMSIQQGS